MAAQAQLIMYDTVGRGSGASTLVKLDPDTGALIQTIGSVGYTVNGLEWANGKLYASTSANDANFPSGLLEINTLTGQGTPIGTDFNAPDLAVVSITSNSSGQLYGWVEPGVDSLAIIDPVTGLATLLGDSDLSTWTLGLAFDANDNLFLVNGDGEVYSIDPANSAATYLYDLTTMAHHGDFNPLNGRYYGINEETGISLIVADLGLSSGNVVATLPTVDNLHTITFAVVPEPAQATAIASLVLLGFVLLRRRPGGMSR